MHPYAAAAELRAAERRCGAARDLQQESITGGLQVADVRQSFSQLKGFLGFAFSTIDRAMRVADPEVRGQEMIDWRRNRAACSVQSFTRKYLSAKRRRGLMSDLRNRIMYDCFHVSCNAPLSLGVNMDISIR